MMDSRGRGRGGFRGDRGGPRGGMFILVKLCSIPYIYLGYRGRGGPDFGGGWRGDGGRGSFRGDRGRGEFRGGRGEYRGRGRGKTPFLLLPPIEIPSSGNRGGKASAESHGEQPS